MSRVDQRGLGDDADRMAGLGQHLQDAARDAVAALDRLVGIGVGAQRDRAWPRSPARRAPRCSSPAAFGLGDEPGLEVVPGRQAEPGVARPGEAVDAAVLAAAIGVDRAVEGDVGRAVADDGRRAVSTVICGLERRQVLQRLPAVVEKPARHVLVTARNVGARTAPPPPIRKAGRRHAFEAEMVVLCKRCLVHRGHA